MYNTKETIRKFEKWYKENKWYPGINGAKRNILFLFLQWLQLTTRNNLKIKLSEQIGEYMDWYDDDDSTLSDAPEWMAGKDYFEDENYSEDWAPFLLRKAKDELVQLERQVEELRELGRDARLALWELSKADREKMQPEVKRAFMILRECLVPFDRKRLSKNPVDLDALLEGGE